MKILTNASKDRLTAAVLYNHLNHTAKKSIVKRKAGKLSCPGHTYPDMYKVAGQIINLDNFCEAAFLCLFDTSTSILIPLYI